MPHRIPPELLATTPPTQAMLVEAGSGPRRRLRRASNRLACPRTTPGCARRRAPSSSTRTRRQWRRTSTRIASLWLWPLRLVPPARKVTGTPSSVAQRRSLPMSSTSRGTATAWGMSR